MPIPSLLSLSAAVCGLAGAIVLSFRLRGLLLALTAARFAALAPPGTGELHSPGS